MSLPESILIKNQKLSFKTTITYDGIKADIIANVRHDDQCGNGHNSFSVTGDIYKHGQRGDRAFIAGGCIHEEIEKHFPELREAIQYHLCSTDQPSHYVSNAMYHASDRDCHGHLKGEPCNFQDRVYFEGFPIQIKLDSGFIKWLVKLENYDLEVMPVEHKPEENYNWKPKYTFVGYEMDTWYKAPFDTERQALEFLETLNSYKMNIVSVATSQGEGKTPNLEYARSSAIWPDAELADFTEDKLKARLPKLMNEFKAVVESLGLTY